MMLNLFYMAMFSLFTSISEWAYEKSLYFYDKGEDFNGSTDETESK